MGGRERERKKDSASNLDEGRRAARDNFPPSPFLPVIYVSTQGGEGGEIARSAGAKDVIVKGKREKKIESPTSYPLL